MNENFCLGCLKTLSNSEKLEELCPRCTIYALRREKLDIVSIEQLGFIFKGKTFIGIGVSQSATARTKGGLEEGAQISVTESFAQRYSAHKVKNGGLLERMKTGSTERLKIDSVQRAKNSSARKQRKLKLLAQKEIESVRNTALIESGQKNTI